MISNYKIFILRSRKETNENRECALGKFVCFKSHVGSYFRWHVADCSSKHRFPSGERRKMSIVRVSFLMRPNIAIITSGSVQLLQCQRSYKFLNR